MADAAMPDSYKNGYKEGVIFLFFDGEAILIEHRPSGVTFIPNGTTEERDKASEYHDDYILATLHREVDEEFDGNVEVEALQKLCEYQVEDPPIWFHAYVVTDWTGTVPAYTVEEGERYADLKWVPLGDYDEHLELPSAVEACETLQRRVARNDL